MGKKTKRPIDKRKYLISYCAIVVCIAMVCVLYAIIFSSAAKGADGEETGANEGAIGAEAAGRETGSMAEMEPGEAGTGDAGQGEAGTGKTEPEETESGKTTSEETDSLSVSGTKLTDAAGNPVQLKGISTHGLAWYPDYVNEACIRQLKEELGMNVIRLAMYTAENGGYCTDGDKEGLKALVKAGVEYATNCDMYVIIDWHILSDGDPNTYVEEAKEFFREMAKEYAEYTNVLYEICNEPNGGVSWSQVKRYAEEIIPVIREHDTEGIILVGTPNWCQYVDQAAADPIAGYDNIMYTLHFYAATHTDSLRAAMASAVAAGLPVFVSEYGICDASGNGAIDRNQADQWVDAMDELGISYVAWNLSNKAETSAVLKSSCGKTSGFAREDLSDSGKWLWDMLGKDGTDGAAGGPAGSAGAEGSNGASGNGNDGGAGKRPGGTISGNGAGNSGSGAGTGSGASGSTDGTSSEGIEADGLEVAAKIVSSWEHGNATCYEYSLTLTADAKQDGWTIRLTFSSDIALQNGWNGDYTVDGNVLTISSKDYNARMEKGGSVGDVGFIIQSDADCVLER